MITPEQIQEAKDNIGTEVKFRREVLDITQVQLSERLQKRQALISSVEKANKYYTIDNFIAIVKELGGEVQIKWD